MVDDGFPDALKCAGRGNAPLLVDWLVDSVFTVEDGGPPALTRCVAGLRQPAQALTCALLG